MRFINKKIIISILMVLEICSLFLMYKSFNNKNTVLDDVKLVNSEVKNKGFAVMIEGSNGEYAESSSDTFPTNMIYNEKLSGCIDIRGNKIDNALSFENNMATLNTNTTAYCYLYFDRDSTIYYKLVYDYIDNKGVSLLNETSSDTYPVYYYTGNVTNNNIIYANYCWKMVRTTDTGGVKLIYNGAVTDGSCNNSGIATHIETSNTAYKTSRYSIAYVGYMNNTAYYNNWKTFSSDAKTYTFGNSITHDGSKYKLVNTISGTWSSIYNSLNNYHYTCWGGDCTSVYYINYAGDNAAFYLTLTEGRTVNGALNTMLHADDVNATNSTIKAKIDSWYESNIKGISDSNNKLYSNYLENTIYCSNRTTTTLGAFNPNGGSNTSDWSLMFNYNTLECENKTDQFTLKESAGGTLGYGNNALDYPIGLLTYKEVDLARNESDINYLNNGCEYWTMSPSHFGSDGAYVWVVSKTSKLTYSGVDYSYGIRPVLSLSKNVLIKNGDGSVTSPYQVELIG